MTMTVMGSERVSIKINRYYEEKLIHQKKHKAVVIFVHGMAEHSGRYEDIAHLLMKHQYIVFTYDQRGHGKSLLPGEKKGYLGTDGFNKMVLDLHEVVNHAKYEFPNTPIYLFGHSMGSFVVQRYLQRFRDIDGIILMGVGYQPKGLSLGIFIAKRMIRRGNGKKAGMMIHRMLNRMYNFRMRPRKTDFDWLNRDLSEVQEYIHDPDCGFPMSYQFYYDFFTAIKKVHQPKNLSKTPKNLPILMMSGSDDPVGNMGRAIRKLHKLYRQYTHQADVKVYDEARHELLHELDKDRVYRDLLDWLEKQQNKYLFHREDKAE